MSTLVDIVIPVYNKETTIKKCIDSILEQTYDNFNIIIVDDGSTDNSVKVCAEYIDERIKLICQENAGVGEARNTGITYLTGEKVVFIDADDFVSSSYLQDLLQYSKYDLVVQGYISCTEDGTICNKMMPKNRVVEYKEYGNVLFDINFFRYMTIPWNKLFDTEIIKRNNIRFRNINLGEDICFAFDYIQYTNTVIFTGEMNYHYVQSVGSLTRRDIPDVWERQKDINNYCRKEFYPQYGRIWTNMYMRAVKRTLGEAVGNKRKFKEQIVKIHSDNEFGNVRLKYISGLLNKVIYFLLKIKNVTMLKLMFHFS